MWCASRTLKAFGRAFLTSLIAVLALTLGAGTASADVFQFLLTDGNLGSAFPGPYAQVTVNLINGTTAQITFDSLTSGTSPNRYTYLMGDGGSAALNVNSVAVSKTDPGFSVSVSSIMGYGLTSYFTPGPYSIAGAGNEDGLGSYNLRITGFDGWSHSASEITFTLTDTNGTWSSAANVLTPNTHGYIAAIHFFPCIPSSTSGTGCDPNSPGAKAVNGQAGTGYAAGDGKMSPKTLPQVPIPAAAWLFGSGLIGLIAVSRRRSKGTEPPGPARDSELH